LWTYVHGPVDPSPLVLLQQHGDNDAHLLTPAEVLVFLEHQIRRHLPSAFSRDLAYLFFDPTLLAFHAILFVTLVAAELLPVTPALWPEGLYNQERILVDALEKLAQDIGDELNEISRSINLGQSRLSIENSTEQVKARHLNQQ